jgi:hypothetical protein
MEETLDSISQAIPNQGFSIFDINADWEAMDARSITRIFNIASWRLQRPDIDKIQEKRKGTTFTWDLRMLTDPEMFIFNFTDRNGNIYDTWHSDLYDEIDSIITIIRDLLYPSLTDMEIVDHIESDYNLANGVDRTIGF